MMEEAQRAERLEDLRDLQTSGQQEEQKQEQNARDVSVPRHFKLYLITNLLFETTTLDRKLTRK